MSRTFHIPKPDKEEALRMPESQKKIIQQIRHKAAEIRKEKRHKHDKEK